MAQRGGRDRVLEELNAALGATEECQKNYHIRQAIQLIELDGETTSPVNAE